MLVDSGAGAAHRLLAWYDRHHRRLPWRAGPGEPAPDPYRVWLSEVMLQQTTVAAVKPYFEAFTRRWPTVEALAAADEAEVMAAWAGLGYYARARNMIACARAVAADGGRFPDSEEALRALPGLGAYTAAAVAAIAFDAPAVVVDGNVIRVVARLFAISTPLPAGQAEVRRFAGELTPAERPGDFAQAMMDLGATICTPRSPACGLCPMLGLCRAQAEGAPDRFPVKAPKVAGPDRRGTFFWLQSGDEVLLRRRPARGLLGGMRALPSGPWTPDDPGEADAPVPADWRPIGAGRHVFTHFALEWRLLATHLRGERPEGEWWPASKLADAGLPTLFARAAAYGLALDRNAPG